MAEDEKRETRVNQVKSKLADGEITVAEQIRRPPKETGFGRAMAS